MATGLQYRIEQSIAILKKAEKLANLYDPENGFYLAFSGGKDSQALYHIAKLAGVKFKAYFSPTTVDPPQLIRFIRNQYPDVIFEKVQMSIYDMAKKKHILPTQTLRWCCAEFKETAGAGKVTLIGIRHAESNRRARRKEIEVSNHKFSGNFDEFYEWQTEQVRKKTKNINNDNWERTETGKAQEIRCINGKDSIIVSPIIDWSDSDVWNFLNTVVAVPHCELYDAPFNQHRIGCILCPMANEKQKQRDIKLWPHVRKKWLDVIQYYLDNGYLSQRQKEYPNITPELLFDWWISGISWEQFIEKRNHPKLF